MERLTKDKDYQDLKDICEGLEAVGQTPAMTHLRYIKLAEYEQTGYEPADLVKAVGGCVGFLGLVEEGLQVSKWISVKERMPDDSGDYMVLTNGTIEIAPYDKEAAQEGLYPFGYEEKEMDEIGNTLIDWIEISGVTHWMPLPEPPKEV